MSSLSKLVLVCHESSLVSSSFVIRLNVSSGMDVNRETTSKDIMISSGSSITNELLTNDDSWQTRTDLDKDDILELLNLCLPTEFSFQNSYYRQISGTPMGSPLSIFLAESVMQDLEKRSVTHNPDIKTWNTYVDDVLATAKKDKTDDILHCINNTLENIQFTESTHTATQNKQNKQNADTYTQLS